MGTSFCIISGATKVIISNTSTVFARSTKISCLYRNRCRKGQPKQNFINYKTEGRNSTTISSKQRFSSSFIYFEQTHKNLSNSTKKPNKPKETSQHSHSCFTVKARMCEQSTCQVIFLTPLKYHPIIISPKCNIWFIIFRADVPIWFDS